MSRHIKARCDRKVEGTQVKELPPKSGITYSEDEIIERQDRIAADRAEIRELYWLGDITERGEITEV